MAVSEEQRKADIKELQGYLNTVAGENDNIPYVIPDGVYGEATRNAVSDFQQESGLPVTGEVDEQTWRALLKAYETIVNFNASLELIQPFARRELILNEGDTGFVVYIIQAMLDTVGQFYSNLDSPKITGVYDEATVKSVRQLQHILRMNETGKFDRNTWNGLAKLYNFHALIDNSLKLSAGETREAQETREPTVQTIASVG